jgi:hypothetical protein
MQVHLSNTGAHSPSSAVPVVSGDKIVITHVSTTTNKNVTPKPDAGGSRL